MSCVYLKLFVCVCMCMHVRVRAYVHFFASDSLLDFLEIWPSCMHSDIKICVNICNGQ
jgi:hypothetical protein